MTKHFALDTLNKLKLCHDEHEHRNVSLMSNPVVAVARKNSLKGHEEETVRETRRKGNPYSSGSQWILQLKIKINLLL